MPETLLRSPTSGKTLAPVANRTTTPTNNDPAKKVEIRRDYVEVIVSDSRLKSTGSQWGHAAIVIDGIVYSRAHDEYVTAAKDVYLNGGVIYKANGPYKINGNGYRDNAGIVLWLSEREKKIVETELKRRVTVDQEFKRKNSGKTTYSIFDNSCSTNVADVLELVGILAHDPRFLPTPVTPAELLTSLEKSNRFVKKNYYPKKPVNEGRPNSN